MTVADANEINSPVHYMPKQLPWNSAGHEQCLENDSFWIYRSVLILNVCLFFFSRRRELELKNFGPVQVSIGVLYHVGICWSAPDRRRENLLGCGKCNRRSETLSAELFHELQMTKRRCINLEQKQCFIFQLLDEFSRVMFEVTERILKGRNVFSINLWSYLHRTSLVSRHNVNGMHRRYCSV